MHLGYLTYFYLDQYVMLHGKLCYLESQSWKGLWKPSSPTSCTMLGQPKTSLTKVCLAVARVGELTPPPQAASFMAQLLFLGMGERTLRDASKIPCFEILH